MNVEQSLLRPGCFTAKLIRSRWWLAQCWHRSPGKVHRDRPRYRGRRDHRPDQLVAASAARL